MRRYARQYPVPVVISLPQPFTGSHVGVDCWTESQFFPDSVTECIPVAGSDSGFRTVGVLHPSENVPDQVITRVKGRLRPMLGFKTFDNARRVIILPAREPSRSLASDKPRSISHEPEESSLPYPSDCNLLSASTALDACRSVAVLPAGPAATPSTPTSVGVSNPRSVPHASAAAQNAGPALTTAIWASTLFSSRCSRRALRTASRRSAVEIRYSRNG